MCCFLSALSNGKGKVLFFRPEEIGKLMAEGNPKNYDPNSYTSIADYNGIKGADEDLWNKWEFDVEKKELKIDTLNADDDRKKVLAKIKKFLSGKDTGALRNLYGLNLGNQNNGNQNNGNQNNGNQNNGNQNNGYQNNGNQNNGHQNNGHRNNGDRNNGDQNNGHRNNGDRNNGDRNNGHQNNGNRNNGNWNNGHRNNGHQNNGNRNNGNLNKTNGIENSFCTQQKYFLFNQEVTKEEYEKIYKLPYFSFDISEFIYATNMTEEEKAAHPEWKVTGGFVRTMSYEECWKKAPTEFIEAVKKLPKFDAKVFKEISGLEV